MFGIPHLHNVAKINVHHEITVMYDNHKLFI